MTQENVCLGVFFYVQSPYILAEVAIVAARALEYADADVQPDTTPVRKFRKSDGFCGIIGIAPRMLEMFAMMEKVAGDRFGGKIPGIVS